MEKDNVTKNNEKKGLNDNIIIATFEIKKGNLRQKIIGSYENFIKNQQYYPWRTIKTKENEKQIKNCEIYINDHKINFEYYLNIYLIIY